MNDIFILNVSDKWIDMNPIDYFEQEGFLIVSKKSKEDVARQMSDILKYYPPISFNIDDYSLRRNFEIFYAKLKKMLSRSFSYGYVWCKLSLATY